MTKIIIDNYTFDASAKTVTFNDGGVAVNKIQQIRNLDHTGRPVIYDSYNGARGGTFAGNVLTTVYDTTTMSDSDELQITYESETNAVQQGDLTDDSDSVATRPIVTTITGYTASSATDLIPALDVGKYPMLTLKITGTWAGFVQWAFSPTGTSTDWSAEKSVGANSTFQIPRKNKWFKCTVTSYTSGTINASLTLHGSPLNLGVDRIGYPVPPEAIFMGMQDNGGNLAPIYSLAGAGDASSGNKIIAVGQLGFTGLDSSRLRYANVFKTVSATATGNTAVWVPTTGKKFRMLGYQIDVSQNAARSGTGVMTIKFQDATTDMGLAHTLFVPTTAGTTMGAGWSTGFVPIGAPGGGIGKMSSIANNTLNINLSTALTAGSCSVTVIGDEE